MLAAMRKFRAGKWEQLWNESIKTADKIKAKKGRKPDQARMRTDREKDKYAQKCADAGNLSKANKIICQELLQACADDTIDKLRLLHPQGDLNFNSKHWPSRDETRAFWAEELVTVPRVLILSAPLAWTAPRMAQQRVRVLLGAGTDSQMGSRVGEVGGVGEVGEVGKSAGRRGTLVSTFRNECGCRPK